MWSIEILSCAFKEDTWQKLVNLCIEKYSQANNEVKLKLEKLNIPKDIIIVLIYRVGGYAPEWLHNEIIALDNNKPIDLLKSDKGRRAVKEALQRMPD
jgi:hypothetical protein